MITVFLKNDPSHTPVISTGGSMLSGSAVQNRYSFEEWRNLSWVREYRSSLKHRHSHLPERSLDSFSHTIFTIIFIPARTTARNDVKGNIGTGSDNGISEK